MSIFVVDDVIEKGVVSDAVSELVGKSFIFTVTSAVPCIVLKSGINLLTDKKLSPALASLCISKS